MWALLLLLGPDCYWPICVWNQPWGWLAVRINPDPGYELLCRCWLHRASAESGACWDLPLDMPLVKLTGSCSDVVWSWPLGMFVLGTLGSDSGAGQCQTLPVLPVTGPGQPTWSYKVIHSLWLPPQSLSVCEKDHAMHQEWLVPALGLGTGQQTSQVTPTFTFTCWLPARLSHWKSLWGYSSCKR